MMMNGDADEASVPELSSAQVKQTMESATLGFSSLIEAAQAKVAAQTAHGTPGGATDQHQDSSESIANITDSDKSSISAGVANSVSGSQADGSVKADESLSSKSDNNEKINADKAKASKKPKRDRSKLRKGKWTVEEEEYTSRIIHYFSNGLLALPEGFTVRSYLADKLNCDPMRVTKKYAGACCLGRRVYHFRDRPQPTIAEMQLAKAELDHLEQRFRMRVEEGHSGIPLPPPSDLLISLSRQANLLFPAAASCVGNPAAYSAGFPGLSSTAVQNPASSTTATTNDIASSSAASSWGAPAPTALLSGSSWLVPPQSSQHRAFGAPSNGSVSGTLHQLDSVIANLALVQAAASLGPALSQLMAEKEQREQQDREEAAAAAAADAAARIRTQLFNKELLDAYLYHLHATGELRPDQSLSHLPTAPPPTTASLAGGAHPSPAPTSVAAAAPGDGVGRINEEQAAGSILMGFLSSLRNSYDEALREKEAADQTDTRSLQNVATTMAAVEQTPAQVTDASSDGNTEDDMLSQHNNKPTRRMSQGPPRKRLKSISLQVGKTTVHKKGQTHPKNPD